MSILDRLAETSTAGHDGVVLRTIDEDTFWQFLAASPYATFQQTPQWGRARGAVWRSQLLGWFDGGGRLVGVCAVRSRRLPALPWSFAYIPFGPIIDWERGDVAALLASLREHLRATGAFGARMIPPLTLHHWDPDSIKAAMQDDHVTSLAQVVPDGTDEVGRKAAIALAQGGWTRVEQAEVDESQALYNVWLPLGAVTEETVRARMNSAWRRNIRLAERNGVEVVEGTRDDLPAVKRMYDETAERLGFATHPLEFFEAMWEAFSEDFPGRFRLHLARHDGEPISAIATVQTGRRAQTVLIANSSHKRQLKASNAIYDAVVRQALADGADLYDFGGVGGSLVVDSADAGLLRFKASMGGITQEYLGTWDLPLIPPLYFCFRHLLPLASSLRARTRRIA
jgi:lipid II:glycine glycyltransferase (peptidoglycan interpeptide bridge formation enzyme)